MRYRSKIVGFELDESEYDSSMRTFLFEAICDFRIKCLKVRDRTPDKYRLNTAFAYAVANSQGATAATTSSNIFSKFLDQQVQLGENLVPEDGRVAFFTYAAAAKLKQDAQYKLNCDASYADVKKGVISMVDGCKIVVVPSSYLPANSTFLLIHEEVLIAPTKFNLIRILTEQKDIDGVYLQMRRYYDCFIPTNKGVAIRFHKES